MTNTGEGQHCECVHDGYERNMGMKSLWNGSMKLEEGEGEISQKKKKYPR